MNLQAAGSEVEYEVVNCGGVSYASYRLVPILDEVLPYEPDVIVLCLYYNDAFALSAGDEEAYYAAIAPHNPLGPISLAAGIQLAASIPNFLCQEQVHLGEGYLKTPFKVEDGYVALPTGPGLGIELDEDALADKIGHDWKNPQTYDADDGSVTDW